MSANKFLSLVGRNRRIVIDGATGTHLTNIGFDPSAHWRGGPAQLHAPDLVMQVHSDYISAGANLIIANTYATNRHVMSSSGFQDECEEANRVGVKLARKAAKLSGEDVVIAGSISTHPPDVCDVFEGEDIHLDNETEGAVEKTEMLTDACTWPAPSDEFDNYCEQARLLSEAGADVIFLEMMKDTVHTDMAVKAANEFGGGLPVVVGITPMVDDSGTVVMRDDPSKTLVDAVNEYKQLENVHGFSVMHCAILNTSTYLEVIRKECMWEGFLGAYPNQGIFKPPDWNVEDPIDPKEFGDFARSWYEEGANAVGGCCGIGPDEIKAVRKVADETVEKVAVA
jgi:homocysteine S-methyltransferase